MEYNKIYEFTVNLSLNIIDETGNTKNINNGILESGSVRGFLSEHIVAKYFSDVFDHVPSKGYDLIEKKTGWPIEVKSFTKYGAKVGPSSFYGKDRKVDQSLFEKDAPTKDFIIVDTSTICDDNTIRLIRKTGKEILSLGHNICYSKKDVLFGN